ncbi:MAG: hypothetical protein HY667_01720 [Chloroflexi bacterium]|nr:hypothetical protein [Chloroflexota bacterium]
MMNSWFEISKGKVLVHSFILGSFVLYSIFLAEPLFDKLETIPGEARLVQAQLPGETNNIRYNLERYIVSASAIELHGWAFIEGYGAERDSVFMVLKSGQATYEFDTFARYTPYITTHYEEAYKEYLNLDWSGFIATIPTRKLKDGEYAIGLYITRDGIQALRYTDKVFLKSKDDVKLLQR